MSSEFDKIAQEANILIPYDPGSNEYRGALELVERVSGVDSVNSMSLEQRAHVARVQELVVSAVELFPQLVGNEVELVESWDITSELRKLTELGVTDLTAFHETYLSYSDLFDEDPETSVIFGLNNIRQAIIEYQRSVVGELNLDEHIQVQDIDNDTSEEVYVHEDDGEETGEELSGDNIEGNVF